VKCIGALQISVEEAVIDRVVVVEHVHEVMGGGTAAASRSSVDAGETTSGNRLPAGINMPREVATR
jgi:hypothetical protein